MTKAKDDAFTTKFVFSGYDLANAAYRGLQEQGRLPTCPDGKTYNWKFSLPDPKNHRSCELMFVWEDKPSEPEKEAYQAGGWKDPDLKFHKPKKKG